MTENSTETIETNSSSNTLMDKKVYRSDKNNSQSIFFSKEMLNNCNLFLDNVRRIVSLLNKIKFLTECIKNMNEKENERSLLTHILQLRMI